MRLAFANSDRSTAAPLGDRVWILPVLVASAFAVAVNTHETFAIGIGAVLAVTVVTVWFRQLALAQATRAHDATEQATAAAAATQRAQQEAVRAYDEAARAHAEAERIAGEATRAKAEAAEATQIVARLTTELADHAAAVARADDTAAAAVAQAAKTGEALAAASWHAAERAAAAATALRTMASELVTAIDAAASGRLTAPLPTPDDPELAPIAIAVQRLVDRMGKTLAPIAADARAIKTSSRALADAGAQLAASSSGSTTEATTLARRAGALHGMLATLSDGARQFSAAVTEIAGSASEAAAIASTAVTATTHGAAMIERLADSSNQIGDVVRTISAIAQQTNLLALNATIEAARAGEAGKGFAVVANEVKELSKATAKASNDIIEMIGAIQTDTRAASAAVGDVQRVVVAIHALQTRIASAVEQQRATTQDLSRSVVDGVRTVDELSADAALVDAKLAQTASAIGRVVGLAAPLAEQGARLDSALSTIARDR